MKTCKHCKKPVTGAHYCDAARMTISYVDENNFVLSAAIGYATDNALIGALAGGSIVGGITGDLLNNGDGGSADHGGGAPDDGGGDGGGGD